MVNSGTFVSKVIKKVSSELDKNASNQIIDLSKLDTIVATIDMKTPKTITKVSTTTTTTTSTIVSAITETVFLSGLLCISLL